MNRILPLTMLIAAGVSYPSAARQNSAKTVVINEDPLPAVAVPAGPTAPVIDGMLLDTSWETAPVHRGFRQLDPAEGEAASEPTEFRVVYTPTAIYVGIRAFDSQPEHISAILARRDDRTPGDEVVIMIDSYLDRRTGYMFAINAAGVKRDAYLYNDTRQDDGWNAVWDAKVNIDSLGWTAEFRIPWSQLRFATSQVTSIGFNVSRQVARLNEEQFWKLTPKTTAGVVSRFGDLMGMSFTPPRSLELLPYIVGGIARRPAVPGDPFRRGSSRQANVGTDLRYGVTSALTLMGTINPDFGQVEADPAEVNLTAFETFQSERRPFFTEGSDLFRFPVGGEGGRFGGSEGLFYSRRIGRAPQGRADARGGFAESAGQTPIFGAAKLTGKTAGGWTVGLLSAVTNTQTAAVIDSVGQTFADAVEPRTGYFVGRLAKDFREGQTIVGAFATSVQRDLEPRLSFLHRAAYAGGLDLSHQFRRGTYRINARVTASEVVGSEEAINRTQRLSARYFQRPDREIGLYDPTRTSLFGYAYSFGVEKQGGGVWRWKAGLERRSPGLELNDIGFLQRADRSYQWASVSRNWFQPGKIFRSLRLELSQRSYWTHAWERRETGVSVSARFTFKNYWSGWLSLGVEDAGIAPETLRGGPAITGPGESNMRFHIGTDRRKVVRFGASAFIAREHQNPSRRVRLGTSVSWRPMPGIDLSAEPSASFNRNTWQYLRTRDFEEQPQYLLGDLNQKTLSVDVRGSMTLSPFLSLQLFAAPFISSVRYDSFSRVVAPRAKKFVDQFEQFTPSQILEADGELAADLNGDAVADVSIGQPNFQYLSFITNVVLRWEYSRGSTLFFVWQHGRSDRRAGGDFQLASGISDLFATQAENVFLVKVNYWLNP